MLKPWIDDQIVRKSPSSRRASDTETLYHGERRKLVYDDDMSPSSKVESCSEPNVMTADIALSDPQLPSTAPTATLDRTQSDPPRYIRSNAHGVTYTNRA
jgi:hypothetical protein